MVATEALAMTVGCPHCGEACELVNGTANGRLSIAIVACSACKREWEVSATILPHNTKGLAR